MNSLKLGKIVNLSMRNTSIFGLRGFLGVWLAFCIVVSVPQGFADEPQAVDFHRDIKPLLSDRCFHCHGPDKESRKADLRLDVRGDAIQLAITPNDSAASEILRRIASDDPDERMPPPDSTKPPLTNEQIAIFKRWIDEGAKYSEHWSFIPLERPKPPAAGKTSPTMGAIDAFVNRRLNAEGVVPITTADRRTLIRRLSFDLTGLPPTPNEVDAFIGDGAPNAYEKLVDRLLASKNFGERMAVYWLDVVRYADTNGYHGDNNRNHVPFRDYVIDAFNSNKRFDQFVREQLAGDLLPSAENDQKIASGFNRLNQTTREGGAQPKEYIQIYSADRVRNTSQIFFGLTMGCCQCHDHKYDPLTMRDFYSFAAFFADIQETPVGVQAPVSLLSSSQKRRDDELSKMIAEDRQKLAAPLAEFDQAQLVWEASMTESLVATNWIVLRPTESISREGALLTVQPDGSILASGENPERDTYTFRTNAEFKDVTALRLELLPDESLKAKGPGRAEKGNFVLGACQLTVGDKPVAFQRATATYSQNGFPVENLIDDNSTTAWAIYPRVGQPHSAILTFTEPIGDGTMQGVTITMPQDFGHQHTIGRFRLSLTTSKDAHVEHARDAALQNVMTILAIKAEERNQAQQDQLRTYFRATAPITAAVRKRIDDATNERKRLVQQARVLISQSMKEPRVVRILNRGNWQDETGEIVQPAVPTSLGSIPAEAGQRLSRLDLANWVVSTTNPLTSRVMVNRLWKLMFGRGLANNLGDFGAQGQPPTHPELLDWLAVEFNESGWNVKHTMKLIAMSDAYRRSSEATPTVLKRDPGNELFARQGRWRLDAEFVRDYALKISGLLSTRIGGASVRPYQPPGYLSNLNFPTRTWVQDTGESQYCRGLYVFWQRTFLHPSLAAFDAPSREECTVQRSVSNTPLQALVLLNDPTYVEAARELARRMITEGGVTDSDRLNFGFREVLSRESTLAEDEVLIRLVNKHRKQFGTNTAAATEFGNIGLQPTPATIEAGQLAAWTSVARAMLNLHESITRE
ncbi:PSD1 and planctomycete cytochrome C domain-containing protein [bacterium]|nr:PSD1 and planctomycete cytochrome C domain-containing protein [bacterium]